MINTLLYLPISPISWIKQVVQKRTSISQIQSLIQSLVTEIYNTVGNSNKLPFLRNTQALLRNTQP